MGEHDDGRRRALCAKIVGEPGELIRPRLPMPPPSIEHVVETDEMRAAVIERIPAPALRTLAVAVEIGLAVILVDDVVLAGNVMRRRAGRARSSAPRRRIAAALRDG